MVNYDNVIEIVRHDVTSYLPDSWYGESREMSTRKRYTHGMVYEIQQFQNTKNEQPLKEIFGNDFPDLMECLNKNNAECVAKVLMKRLNIQYPYVGTKSIPMERVNRDVYTDEVVTFPAANTKILVAESPQRLEDTLAIIQNLEYIQNGLRIFRFRKEGTAIIMLGIYDDNTLKKRVLLTMTGRAKASRPTIGDTIGGGVNLGFTPVNSIVAQSVQNRIATPFPQPTEEESKPPAQPDGPYEDGNQMPEETDVVPPGEHSDEVPYMEVDIVTEPKSRVGLGLGIAGGAIGLIVVGIIIFMAVKKKKTPQLD